MFWFWAKISKVILKFEIAFHKFVELIETNSLIYNTLQFDQYSHLAILFDYFSFFDQKFRNEFES